MNMISRNLWHRLKRLEDKIKQRCEPEMTRKELRLIQRLHAAKRRMALEDSESYAEYGGPDAKAEIIYTPVPDPLIMILHAARKRVHEESDHLKQEAATDGSEHNI